MTEMTETQASKKWCPWAKSMWRERSTDEGTADVGAAVNRTRTIGSGLPECRCLGSGCMAWRWVETLHDARNRMTKRWNCALPIPILEYDEAAHEYVEPSGSAKEDALKHQPPLDPNAKWVGDVDWSGWVLEPSDREVELARLGTCAIAHPNFPGPT